MKFILVTMTFFTNPTEPPQPYASFRLYKSFEECQKESVSLQAFMLRPSPPNATAEEKAERDKINDVAAGCMPFLERNMELLLYQTSR